MQLMRWWILGFFLFGAAARPVQAAPSDAEPKVREAARRFERGVTLYAEADYRGALVEFRRAELLAPSPSALYNIGETEYQLQDYAGALTSFERYLAAASPNDSHRPEVEANAEVLRTRVGYLTITTVPANAELTIDDQPAGKTPLDAPLRVSIGRRKVMASLPGAAPITRYVDVAADDHVALNLPLLSAPSPGAAPPPPLGRPAPANHVMPAPASSGAKLRLAGWIGTGALAAGAVTFGILAAEKSSDLKDAQRTYPTTSGPLRHDARVLTSYAVLADSLGAAALIVGGLTLYSTVSSRSSRERPAARAARLILGPRWLRLEATF